MDNDNLSKIPVSELTPENLNSLKGQGQPTPSEPPKKAGGSRKLPLIIAGIVLLAGVGVALYFIFRSPAENPDSTEVSEGDEEDPNIIWEPSEESENPGGEYIDHHQSIINDSKSTPAEKLDSTLSIANYYAEAERFQEAEAILDGIQREGRSKRELFFIYSAYNNLYTKSGDEASAEKYDALVNEVLNEYWEEGPSQGTSSDEGSGGE